MAARGGFLYSAAFHLLLGRVYDDKDVQERIVRRSNVDWVIVRPVILTNGPKTNAYRALVDPRGWTGPEWARSCNWVTIIACLFEFPRR